MQIFEQVNQTVGDVNESFGVPAESFLEPKLNGPLDENAPVEAENVDVELDEHATVSHIDVFQVNFVSQ